MAPSAVDSQGRVMTGISGHTDTAGQTGVEGKVDTMEPHDYVIFDPSLKPRSYHMKGTDSNSKVLFWDVKFSWNNGDLGKLGELGVEEHTLMTARSAQCYIDSGYTMCYGAASASERLDCVIRDAINEGNLPGPRYLANGKEMAVPDGELVPGVTAFATGPLEMRETIRHHILDIGVDNVKLSMSGEQICETRDAQDCYYTDEETAACVDEAHRHGVRL